MFCFHIRGVMYPFLLVYSWHQVCECPLKHIKGPIILASLPRIKNLYALVVCRHGEGLLTMSNTLGIKIMNSILELEISLPGSSLKVNMGQMVNLSLDAHKLVKSFHWGVEMYLCFTRNSDPTVEYGLAICSFFLLLLAIVMGRWICEFLLSHVQYLYWGPELKQVTLWPNPVFLPKIRMPWYF